MKRNKITWIVLLVLLALSAMSLSACSGAASAATETEGTPAAPRLIAVSGHGTVSLVPDLAYVSIGVHTEDKDAKEAVAANNAQAKAVMDALKAFGIADKDLQTSNFNVYPRQEWGPDNQVIGVTYVVDNTVRVTVRDLSKIGAVLDATVEAGANNIYGVQFDVEDRESAYQDALKAAVANAQERAAVTAGAAGVEVGEVQSIQTSVSGGGIPPMPMVQAEVFKAAGDVSVAAGEMEVSADVSMTFVIK